MVHDDDGNYSIYIILLLLCYLMQAIEIEVHARSIIIIMYSVLLFGHSERNTNGLTWL